MKKTTLTISFILLFIFSGAQVIKSSSGYLYQTGISLKDNGKYSYSFAACRDTTAKILVKHPDKPLKIENQSFSYNSGKLPQSVYQVIFHFDRSPGDLICNGTDTAIFSALDMTWINNLTIEAWLPEGYYDIVSYFFDNSGEPAYVFVKDFYVNMNKDTTILSTSANHKVTLNGVDENNILLPGYETGGDELGVLIEFPEIFKCPSLFASFGGWPTNYVKFSDVRPDIKIYLGETAMVKPQQYHRYEISYPALMGITKDTTLTNNPSDYGHYALIYNGSPAVSDPYFVFGYGNMNNCLLGSLDFWLISWGIDDYPSKPTDTVQLYSSNVAVDTNKYLFCYSLGHCEYNPSTMSGFLKLINDWLYYVTPDDNLVLSASGKYPPVTGDYQVADEMTADLGSNAPFDFGFTNNSSNGYQIRVRPYFSGQANERRGVDDGFGTYDIWCGNQHLYHDSIRNDQIFWGATGPDIYSVVMNDSNYQVCGKSGYLQIKKTFDLGNDDANPPRLKSMQILMGDSIAENIIHGFPSSVRFTAGDWIAVPGVSLKVFHELKEAHLYYKNFNEVGWQELIVQPHPESLDSIQGMPYSTSLEQALNQYPDSAWIDLKIELIDSAGNSNIQIIHPAFLVRDAMTGIKPFKNDPPVFLYPDPASDKINIVTDEEEVCVTIYSMTGQPVMEVFNDKEINISLLKPGLYMVKIKNTINGRISVSKFIKE